MTFALHVSAEGKGRPVVFFHGAGADQLMFAAQRVALVAAGFRVVLVDLPGHGLSRPHSGELNFFDDAEALLEWIEKPVLVGHSLGGNLAQELVRRRPAAYSGLVVLDSTWNTGPLSALEKFGLKIAAPTLKLMPQSMLFRTMANASAVTTHARADLLRAFSVMTKDEFIAVWRATAAFVKPDPSWKTPVPLLLVRGAEDRTGNIATAMPKWARHEGITETVIPGAGHAVTLDAPEAVNEVLLEFLRANSAGTSV